MHVGAGRPGTQPGSYNLCTKLNAGRAVAHCSRQLAGRRTLIGLRVLCPPPRCMAVVGRQQGGAEAVAQTMLTSGPYHKWPYLNQNQWCIAFKCWPLIRVTCTHASHAIWVQPLVAKAIRLAESACPLHGEQMRVNICSVRPSSMSQLALSKHVRASAPGGSIARLNTVINKQVGHQAHCNTPSLSFKESPPPMDNYIFGLQPPASRAGPAAGLARSRPTQAESPIGPPWRAAPRRRQPHAGAALQKGMHLPPSLPAQTSELKHCA